MSISMKEEQTPSNIVVLNNISTRKRNPINAKMFETNSWKRWFYNNKIKTKFVFSSEISQEVNKIIFFLSPTIIFNFFIPQYTTRETKK